MLPGIKSGYTRGLARRIRSEYAGECTDDPYDPVGIAVLPVQGFPFPEHNQPPKATIPHNLPEPLYPLFWASTAGYSTS